MTLRSRLAHASDCNHTGSQLHFSREAWKKLQAYATTSAPNEINGFGLVTLENGVFRVSLPSDVFITEQTVTPSAANVTGRAFAKAQYRADQAGRSNDLRLQWHSHVYGQAYHSDTDMNNIEDYNYMDWFISLVTTVHGEVTARLDTFRPFRLGAQMQIWVHDEVDEGLMADIENDVDALVTVTKPPRKTVRRLAPASK